MGNRESQGTEIKHELKFTRKRNFDAAQFSFVRTFRVECVKVCEMHKEGILSIMSPNWNWEENSG